MSVIEKLELLRARADTAHKYADVSAAYEACGIVAEIGPAIRQAMIDAERWRAVRAICCSAEGPSDELASAWMTGDEAATDLAADMARATGEGEGHD